MKKTLIALTALVAGFVACKKDSSDPTPTTQQMILGKWMQDSSFYKEYNNGTLVREGAFAADSVAFWKFNADNTYEDDAKDGYRLHM